MYQQGDRALISLTRLWTTSVMLMQVSMPLKKRYQPLSLYLWPSGCDARGARNDCGVPIPAAFCPQLLDGVAVCCLLCLLLKDYRALHSSQLWTHFLSKIMLREGGHHS